ncbi:MAG TPA: hypothetical protein VEQ66_03970 [Propionibacteriaceae bacterium]|nr:hypothetical protein [Propionibacteriaceae bacterium]
MSAHQLVDVPPVAVDPLVARLDEVLAGLGSAVADASEVDDAVRIDRIARLEKLRAVTAALQAVECVRFAQSQVAEQMAADVHPSAVAAESPTRSRWPATSRLSPGPVDSVSPEPCGSTCPRHTRC